MKIKMIVSLMIMSSVILFSGCVTENKAIGLSDSSNGFMVRATGSVTTGSYPFPELWLAGNQFSYASSPIINKTDQVTSIPVFTMTSHRSFFGSLFGIDDTSYSLSYIGCPGETAEQSAARVRAIGETARAIAAEESAAATDKEQ